MCQFKLWRSIVDLMIRRNKGMTLHDVYDHLLQVFYQQKVFLQETHGYGSDQELACELEVVIETLFEKRGRPTIFVESAVIEMILGSKFSVTSRDIVTPMSCFSLALETKRDLRPCLVYRFKGNSIQRDVMEVFSFLGDKKVIRELENADPVDEDKGTVAAMVRETRDGVLGNLIVHDSFTGDLYQADEKDHDRRELNFALKLCAYIQAFPDSFKKGVPQKNQIEGRFDGKGFCVGLPERFRNLGGTHASPHAHIRSFHFRALRDERFKRNEDGSIRIVPVRMTLVGKDKLDPYHVEIPDGEHLKCPT